MREIRQNGGLPVHILVVEDSTVQAEALRRMLAKEGYTVSVAKNGVEGLSITRGKRPDLVITDILMPEMNGFELCGHIKIEEKLKGIPVILLTSLNDPKDVINGLKCGADNFITKPFDERYLLSRIKYMLLTQELRMSDRTQMGVEIYFGGEKHLITSERQQILDILLSTYETAVQKNFELIKVQDDLKALNAQLELKVEERTSSLVEEIARRKKAEENISHLNILLRAIRSVSQLITRENNCAQLLQEACKSLFEMRGYRSAWIALLDESGKLITTAEAGLGERFSSMVKQLERGDLPKCGLKARKDSGVLVIDENRAECIQCSLADIYSGSASMSTRLEYGGKIYGLITVSVPLMLTIDEEEKHLFQEVSTDIAFALHNLEVQAEKKQAEEAKEKALHDLAERVKKLNFLYAVTRIFVESDLSLEKIFQRVADLIPPAFQYPEKTCARLLFEGREFRTSDFRESPWKLSADIIASGEKAGSVEVYCLGEISENDKEPFLNGERDVIKDLGIQLSIIIEHRRAEEEVRQSRKELAIRNRVATIFLTTPDDEMYNEVLKVVLEVMESKYGVFGYINEDGALVIPSMARDIWDECQVPGKTFTFPRETWGDSSWPRAIREKKTYYTNERSNLTPEGHITIQNHISKPIIYQGEVIGLIQTANKQTDYEHKDIQLLETLGDQIAPILNARLQRDRQEKEHKNLEERFRLAAESASDLIYEWDIKERIDWFGKIDDLLGYAPNEFPRTLDAWVNSVHPDDRDRVVAAIKSHLEKDEPYDIEYHIRKKDGTTNYWWTRGTAVRDEKGNPYRWVGAVTDITDRKQTEEILRHQKEQLQAIMDASPVAISWADMEGNIEYNNRKFRELFGYTVDDIPTITAWRHRAFPDEAYRKTVPLIKTTFPDGQKQERDMVSFDVMVTCKDGSTRYITQVGTLASNRILVIYNDLTERKRAEEEMATLQEQLRQSQKMEAIGRLAGGIAHDFNNLLTVIKGYSQLSLLELKEDDPLKGNIEEVKKAAERAAGLTHQLLAFSRHQVMEIRVLDLNTLLNNLDKMLRRVIGEDIELVTLLADDLGGVKTDPGQIEQVIMNLAINAKDAMSDGGKLTIETANVELDEVYVRNHVAVEPGRYAMLSVSDTGVGMVPEVKERIFEPFFTTKETGKGTGLGLSTAYGIVKQSGGNIWVYSETGKGTTFKIYLPRVDEPLEKVEEKVVKGGLPRGDETILVAEDEEEVRKVAVRILSEQGYKVLEASQGMEAFLICEEHDSPIHLLLTDVVMPKMSGRELAERLLSICPEIKVLYMSGYTDNSIVHHGVLEKGVSYIQKPFTVERLVRKVREVLDK